MAIRSHLNLIARRLTSVPLGKPVRLLVSVHVRSLRKRELIIIEKEIGRDVVHIKEEDVSINGFIVWPWIPRSLSTENQDGTFGS